MGYDPGEARDDRGRWSGGGGQAAAPGRISVGFKQASEWVKSGEAQRAIAGVVTSDRVKTAVSLGIKSALYHLGNMDDPAMEVLDPHIHNMVHNIGATLQVTSGRARDLAIASVRAMRAARMTGA